MGPAACFAAAAQASSLPRRFRAPAGQTDATRVCRRCTWSRRTGQRKSWQRASPPCAGMMAGTPASRPFPSWHISDSVAQHAPELCALSTVASAPALHSVGSTSEGGELQLDIPRRAGCNRGARQQRVGCQFYFPTGGAGTAGATACLALPCLALPCLALPCLALPCLALPSRRPRPLHSCGWTVGIVRHACCTSARARTHAQAPSRLSARIHPSERSRRVAARRVVGPVCPVYDHALELGRLRPHYSLLLTANTCTPIAHIIRRADLPNPDPPACT